MSLNRTTLNVFAASLIETLTSEGIIESHAYLASMVIGFDLNDFQSAIEILIKGGLVRRVSGPKLVPGNQFEAVKAAMEKFKASKEGKP